MNEILLVSSYARGNLVIPNGILSLGTILTNNNYDVEIVDFLYLQSKGVMKNAFFSLQGIDEMVNYLCEKRAKIIGFSCMCNNYHVYIMMVQKIKKINPTPDKLEKLK